MAFVKPGSIRPDSSLTSIVSRLMGRTTGVRTPADCSLESQSSLSTGDKADGA
jgi:hypothetical protein